MKKVLIIISVFIIFAIILIGTTYRQIDTNYLRIHIRANSNAEVDQIIKYKIKDQIVEYLTPHIATCNSFDDVKSCLEENLDKIDKVATSVLKDNNYQYEAHSKVTAEEFPTRSYGDFVLEAGYYDALIVELGEAKGDNWWCVVYPPLCFTSTQSGSNAIYRSRILDLIYNRNN